MCISREWKYVQQCRGLDSVRELGLRFAAISVLLEVDCSDFLPRLAPLTCNISIFTWLLLCFAAEVFNVPFTDAR